VPDVYSPLPCADSSVRLLSESLVWPLRGSHLCSDKRPARAADRTLAVAGADCYLTRAGPSSRLHSSAGAGPVSDGAAPNSAHLTCLPQKQAMLPTSSGPRRRVGDPRYRGAMQLIGLLVAAALVIKLWPWIVAIVALIVAVVWARRAADRHAVRIEAKRRRLAELAARADQHAWVMAGDERGVYGPDGAELMHYIYSAGAPTGRTVEPGVRRWRIGRGSAD